MYTGLPTRPHPAMGRGPNAGCRYCGLPETNEHVATGCNKFKASIMKQLHDSSVRKVYDGLCIKYDLAKTEFDQPVPVVQQNAHVELYWDRTWVTEAQIRFTKPDVIDQKPCSSNT
ncbi:unnamed protein product [Caenorhabditis auriculariae]|uniref:Uncharacterized protein n=1 Tax=Caenorhabditis auriculariae TaxID=2777116 RepID=A0A8S1HAD0_9PELO|nr:unnamed protein product [Caenorhabditis auriculariae]